jgi:hypothetical protein
MRKAGARAFTVTIWTAANRSRRTRDRGGRRPLRLVRAVHGDEPLALLLGVVGIAVLVSMTDAEAR